MKTKVFIITDNLAAHGAQRQILEYLKHADREVFNIKIINLDVDCDFLGDEIRKLGFEIVGIRHKGFFNPRTIFKLMELFRKERPDIILTYLFTSDSYGRLAAKLTGVPIIISSVRNLDLWKKPHHIFAARMLGKLTDKFIINSESVRSFLVEKEGVDPKDIVRIYNGIDLNRFRDLKDAGEVRRGLGISQDAFVVGMVARFNEQKDHKTFLSAAASVIKINPKVYFLAIGDGQTRGALEDLARQAGIAKNVIFTGARDDVPDLMNCFDIGVLSSHYESCPNAILEYMACRKPVIASNVGGNAELVADGLTGYIIEPRDPQALAEKILSLLADKELRGRMGKEGRSRVEKEFSVEIMVKETQDLFRKLMEEKVQNKIRREKTQGKIGYIVSLFPCWSETFILNEILELKKRGLGITIFSVRRDLEKFTHDKARPLSGVTRYAPLRGVFLGMAYWFGKKPYVLKDLVFLVTGKRYKNIKDLSKYLWCIGVACYFARIVEEDGIEHLHAHFATYPAFVAFCVSKLTGKPYTFTAHAHDIFLKNPFLKELVASAKKVIAISDFNKKYISDQCGAGVNGKIEVVHCGIDMATYRALGTTFRDTAVLLSVGRLTEMKGFEYLLGACARIKDRSPFKCRIIGDGPDRRKLEKLAARLGLVDIVSFEGVVDNDRLKEYFKEASALVMPSVWSDKDGQDGIPIVLMEAMASGVPVIASRISGIPELVIDNETGLLAEPKNIDELAAKIKEILQNKALREKLISGGRLKVEREFDVAKNADALLGIFMKAI